MRKKTHDDLLKSPSFRVLLVMDAIGVHGPVSLNQLCELLPVSRAGIWRAAATLRDYGWVRISLSDNAYELTSKLDFKMANAHFAHEATETAVEAIQTQLENGAKYVDVGMFIAPGNFIILDSTRPDVQIGRSLSLVNNSFAIAVQAQLPADVLLRHLNAYRKTAPEHEALAITSGKLARVIREEIAKPCLSITSMRYGETVSEETLFLCTGSI